MRVLWRSFGRLYYFKIKMKPGKLNKNRNNIPEIIFVSSLILFLILTAAVSFNLTLSFDKTVLLSLRNKNNLSVPLFNTWLLPLMRGITFLGNSDSVTVITFLLAVYLIVKKEFGLLGIILAAIISGSLIDLFLKWYFARNRPEIVPHLVTAYYYSFPSGHAFISAVLYPAVAIIFIRITDNITVKTYITVITVLLVLLIGFSRIYLGVHFPSDVIAGWLIGLCWSSWLWILAKKMTK